MGIAEYALAYITVVSLLTAVVLWVALVWNEVRVWKHAKHVRELNSLEKLWLLKALDEKER